MQQGPQAAGPQYAPPQQQQHYAPAASGAEAHAAGPPFKVYVAGVTKSFAAEDLQPYFEKVRCLSLLHLPSAAARLSC